MLLILLTALALAPPPADAASGATPSSKVAAKSTGVVKDPDAMTCKYDNPTGRRIATRICRSNREWDELERQSKEVLRTSGAQGRCPGGDGQC